MFHEKITLVLEPHNSSLFHILLNPPGEPKDGAGESPVRRRPVRHTGRWGNGPCSRAAKVSHWYPLSLPGLVHPRLK